MAAFATAQEFATFSQRDLTAADTATVELLLDMASAAIRAYTGQTISAVANDVVTLDPPCGPLLFLPQLPVTAVASITVEGLAMASTDFYWYRDTGIVRRASRAWRWGHVPQSVVVTYSHGYAADSSEMMVAKSVCLDATAAMFGGHATGSGVKSETVGSYSVTYETAARTLAEVDGGRLNVFRTLVLA